MIKGIELLKTLPEPVKQQINKKYGSLEKYYESVIQRYRENSEWSLVQTEEARVRRYEIQMKIFDL